MSKHPVVFNKLADLVASTIIKKKKTKKTKLIFTSLIQWSDSLETPVWLNSDGLILLPTPSQSLSLFGAKTIKQEDTYFLPLAHMEQESNTHAGAVLFFSHQLVTLTCLVCLSHSWSCV